MADAIVYVVAASKNDKRSTKPKCLDLSDSDVIEFEQHSFKSILSIKNGEGMEQVIIAIPVIHHILDGN